MTTLAEVRERHERVCMIGKETGREHQQSPAHYDRAFLLSLLDEIEALPDKWQHHLVSDLDASFWNAINTCADDLRAIIARGVE